MVWKTLKALDKKIAGLIGFSGRRTVSAECNTDSGNFCRFVCWLTNFFEPNHCGKASEREPDVSQP